MQQQLLLVILALLSILSSCQDEFDHELAADIYYDFEVSVFLSENPKKIVSYLEELKKQHENPHLRLLLDCLVYRAKIAESNYTPESLEEAQQFYLKLRSSEDFKEYPVPLKATTSLLLTPYTENPHDAASILYEMLKWINLDDKEHPFFAAKAYQNLFYVHKSVSLDKNLIENCLQSGLYVLKKTEGKYPILHSDLHGKYADFYLEEKKAPETALLHIEKAIEQIDTLNSYLLLSEFKPLQLSILNLLNRKERLKIEKENLFRQIEEKGMSQKFKTFISLTLAHSYEEVNSYDKIKEIIDELSFTMDTCVHDQINVFNVTSYFELKAFEQEFKNNNQQAIKIYQNIYDFTNNCIRDFSTTWYKQYLLKRIYLILDPQNPTHWLKYTNRYKAMEFQSLLNSTIYSSQLPFLQDYFFEEALAQKKQGAFQKYPIFWVCLNICLFLISIFLIFKYLKIWNRNNKINLELKKQEILFQEMLYSQKQQLERKSHLLTRIRMLKEMAFRNIKSNSEILNNLKASKEKIIQKAAEDLESTINTIKNYSPR